MPVKSISELRTELVAKERRLARLQANRGRLARQVAALDRQIRALSGLAPRGRRKKVKKVRRGRRKVARKGVRRKKARRRKVARRRRAAGMPLAACIKKVLARNKDGLSVTETVKAVTAAGSGCAAAIDAERFLESQA